MPDDDLPPIFHSLRGLLADLDRWYNALDASLKATGELRTSLREVMDQMDKAAALPPDPPPVGLN